MLKLAVGKKYKPVVLSGTCLAEFHNSRISIVVCLLFIVPVYHYCSKNVVKYTFFFFLICKAYFVTLA